MKQTLCIGMTPAVQELREFNRLVIGEVNRSPAIHRSVAGKGPNVARVLRQLGGHPLLLGFVGGDTGQFIRDGLRREGVPEKLTLTRHSTRVCTTLMDRSTRAITELVEEAQLPTAGEWRQFFATYRSCLPRARYVVIAGALMPGAAPEIYQRLARCDTPVIIDSQKEPLLGVLQLKPWLAKLNVHELENTLGGSLRTERQSLPAARRLMDLGAQNVVVTHGAHGVWLMTTAGTWHYRPPKIEPVNPIGSGDAVTAGIVRAMERGAALPEAVRYGVACGSANALTLIAGTLHLEDVNRLLRGVRVSSR